MELKDIVAISGLSGLFEVVAKRQDGLIVKSLDGQQSKFVSNRIHVFTPLDGITIYTETDTIELVKVLPEIKKQEKTNPPVDVKADNKSIKAYFRKILPDYDEERVYVSDIKKILKWYHALQEHNLIKVPEPEKKETKKTGKKEGDGVATSKIEKEKKPAKATGSKKKPTKKGDNKA